MTLPHSLRSARRSSRAALLLTLVGGALAVPGPAFGAPEYATPDPGSPAGTEYGLPFQQGRGAGGGGDGSLNGGGPVGGPGGSGGSGGPGGGASAGGTGGSGTATSASTAALFGAGITPAHRARSSSGSGGKGRGGARSEDGSPSLSARAVADVASARASTADGQVALIVVVLLGGAAALAVVLRLVGRRSPPASAA